MYNNLIFSVENNCCTITLNRPESYNAFTEELSAEFIDALKKANKDDNIRVVVITGAGKGFCSGQDLNDVKKMEGQRSLGESVIRRYNPMILGVREMSKPVICKMNGVGAGAGASLAWACDIIIASENASFVQAFAKIGLVLDSGSSYFMPQMMSYQKAFELCTLGDKLMAKEAFDMGLINKCVPHELLDNTVAEYVRKYVAAAPKSMAMIKKMLNKGTTGTLRELLTYEAYCQEIAGSSADYKEGVNSFLEKRVAVFTGK